MGGGGEGVRREKVTWWGAAELGGWGTFVKVVLIRIIIIILIRIIKMMIMVFLFMIIIILDHDNDAGGGDFETEKIFWRSCKSWSCGWWCWYESLLIMMLKYDDDVKHCGDMWDGWGSGADDYHNHYYHYHHYHHDNNCDDEEVEHCGGRTVGVWERMIIIIIIIIIISLSSW